MKPLNYETIFHILASLQEGEKPVRKLGTHDAQTYHYLKKLEAGGFVQSHKAPGDNGQMRLCYRLTERGWTLATLGRRVLELTSETL